jgi:predicted nucleic acid-binding protein
VRAPAGQWRISDVRTGFEHRHCSTRASLRVRGIAKADFDLLIASTALALGATLVTGDRALLDGSIAGLQVENWLAA